MTKEPAFQLSDPQSLSDRVYEALLKWILSGGVQPGDRLVVDAIVKQFGLSNTPIRDALGRLEQDGLVVHYPYRGYAVRLFDENEIREIYQVRAALETYAVRLVCRSGGAKDFEAIQRIQLSARSAMEMADQEVYREHNEKLHAAILDASGNATLAASMERILNQVRLLVAQTTKLPGRPQRGVREHQHIVELMMAGDEMEAARAMEDHILGALPAAMAVFRQKMKGGGAGA